MKKNIFQIFLFILISPGFQAQEILNGDFEDFIYCPPLWGPDLTVAQTMEGWIGVTGTADGLHNSCPPLDPGNMSNMAPIEYGNGYGGIWGLYEAMGHALDEPLLAGGVYEFSFDASYADLFQPLDTSLAWCSVLCLYGSMEAPPNGDPWFPSTVGSLPQLHLLGCSTPVTDSLNWNHFSFIFVPDSAYGHVTLSLMQDDACASSSAYLAIDNLLIVPHLDDFVEEKRQPEMAIYPNPSDGHFSCKINEFQPIHWEIFDLSGRKLKSGSWQESREKAFQFEDIAPGSYLFRVSDETMSTCVHSQVHIQ